MIDINTKVKEVIAQHLKISVRNITDDSCLVEDLGADSLDLYEMYIEVEEAFGLENTDPPSATKVKDFEAWIKKYVQS